MQTELLSKHIRTQKTYGYLTMKLRGKLLPETGVVADACCLVTA